MKKVYLQPVSRVCSSFTTTLYASSGNGEGLVGGGDGNENLEDNTITTPSDDDELDLGAKKRFYGGF